MKKKHPWLVEIGKNIRAIRESKGLSQEELAELVDIDRTYIERGERNVASLNLIRIAIALNTEVGNLFPRLDILQLSSR